MRDRGALPAELAFLEAFFVPREVLCRAVARAAADGVDPCLALIASGEVSETRYYRCLAERLDRPFVADWPHPAAPLDLARALRRNRVKLAGDPRATWLTAPCGIDIQLLLEAHARGVRLPSLAITTPSHLDAILRHRTQASITYAASHALPDDAPALSAKAALGPGAILVIALALAGLLGGALVCGRVVADAFGTLFLASIVFRLIVCAGGMAVAPAPRLDAIADQALPPYTVLVPLYDEAGMVPGLVAALERLDYPTGKLEVLFLVEADDRATRAALVRARLRHGFKIVDVPDGAPRTKPRALNAGLVLARGTYVAVYDAEDRPEPDQLRAAAARFALVPETVACLQAHLAIADVENRLLPRLFAIEYAILFDVFNVGLARWRLPLALGGTSNHFRIDALRAVGAWDAWNVTEDADLGLRLARWGYTIDMLASTTWEEAPERFGIWLKQRRRWTKGWMQTLLVLARGLPRVVGDLGVCQSLVVTLMLTNLVTGPLLTPIFLVLVVWRLAAHGLPTPHGFAAVVEAALAFSVIVIGAVGTVWSGVVGARRRGVGTLPSLLAFLPYQLMISAAALGGLVDLVRRPYHWHKTRHGEAARKPTRRGGDRKTLNEGGRAPGMISAAGAVPPCRTRNPSTAR